MTSESQQVLGHCPVQKERAHTRQLLDVGHLARLSDRSSSDEPFGSSILRLTAIAVRVVVSCISCSSNKTAVRFRLLRNPDKIEDHDSDTVFTFLPLVQLC